MTATLETRSEVMDRKIEGMVNAGRSSAEAALSRLMNDTIGDSIGYVGPTSNGAGKRKLSVAVDPDSGLMRLYMGNDGDSATLHPHAAAQLAERLELPAAWSRGWALDGKPWQKTAIADVLQASIANTATRQRVLVRSVGGEVRAVMSDQYRRLSSPDILRAFHDAAVDVGAVPVKATVTDLNWAFDLMIPRSLALDLGPHGQEFVTAGLTIRNSDFGSGALSLAFRILRLACINGAVTNSVMREVHLGARLPEDIVMSDETFRLDTRATASAIGDAVRGLLSTESVKRRFIEAQAAASTAVDPEIEISALVKARRISLGEAKDLGATLARSDLSQIPSGPATRWKVSQALSWLSHSAGADRSAELESLAGSLIFTAK